MLDYHSSGFVFYTVKVDWNHGFLTMSFLLTVSFYNYHHVSIVQHIWSNIIWLHLFSKIAFSLLFILSLWTKTHWTKWWVYYDTFICLHYALLPDPILITLPHLSSSLSLIPFLHPTWFPLLHSAFFFNWLNYIPYRRKKCSICLSESGWFPLTCIKEYNMNGYISFLNCKVLID